MHRALSVVIVVPGGVRVANNAREWCAGASQITFAEWRHKHRKHLRKVQDHATIKIPLDAQFHPVMDNDNGQA
jgi:hypothetical protein